MIEAGEYPQSGYLENIYRVPELANIGPAIIRLQRRCADQYTTSEPTQGESNTNPRTPHPPKADCPEILLAPTWQRSTPTVPPLAPSSTKLPPQPPLAPIVPASVPLLAQPLVTTPPPMPVPSPPVPTIPALVPMPAQPLEPQSVPMPPPIPVPPLVPIPPSTRPSDIAGPPGPSNQPLHNTLSAEVNAPEVFLMDRASAMIQALSKGGCCACPARSAARSPLVDPLHIKLVQQALADVTDTQQFLNSALMRQYEAVSRSVWRIHSLKELFKMSESTSSVPFHKPQTSAPKHPIIPPAATPKGPQPSAAMPPTRLLSRSSKSTKNPDGELANNSDVEIVESPYPSKRATQKRRRTSTSSEGSVELVESRSTIIETLTSPSASSESLEASFSSESDDLPSGIIMHQPQHPVSAGRESLGSTQTQERKFVLHIRSVHR